MGVRLSMQMKSKGFLCFFHFFPGESVKFIISYVGILHFFNQANTFLLGPKTQFHGNTKSKRVQRFETTHTQQHSHSFRLPNTSGMVKRVVFVAGFQHSFYCVFAHRQLFIFVRKMGFSSCLK